MPGGIKNVQSLYCTSGVRTNHSAFFSVINSCQGISKGKKKKLFRL
jgi:hypothetical protein